MPNQLDRETDGTPALLCCCEQSTKGKEEEEAESSQQKGDIFTFLWVLFCFTWGHFLPVL